MAKKKKSDLSILKKTLLITAGAAAASGLLWITVGKDKIVPVPSYTAKEVIDGDTFITQENQLIRLSGVDAPEKGRCGYVQSRKELEKMVSGKQLYIKVVYNDGYHRLSSLVYANGQFINAEMLRTGWASMYQRDAIDMTDLQKATKEARDRKIGIFSTLCTQDRNPKNPGCTIKGNIGEDNQTIFHSPGCRQYNQVVIELYKGDAWFCTENEAKGAGFKKASDCP